MNTSCINTIINLPKILDSEKLLLPYNNDLDYQNELLFFFKPELLLLENQEVKGKIIHTILEKIESFAIDIGACFAIPGTVLDTFQIMDQHYGYINKLSKNASTLLTSAEKNEMKEMLELGNSSDCIFLGGHEFLAQYSSFDAEKLDAFWLSKKSIKKRSGFYFQTYQYDSKDIVLINGFHPVQLKHFTNPEHLIVVFLLRTNTDWQEMKDIFAGNTFPELAVPESIRGYLYNHRDQFQIPEISISRNFVHLSAGPFEALFEMNNFFCKSAIIEFSLENTVIHSKIKDKELGLNTILHLLNNPIINQNGKKVDLFTGTENMNTDTALNKFLSQVVQRKS